MQDVAVIDDPAAAITALDPIRARLLTELSAPASAATRAARLGLAPPSVRPASAIEKQWERLRRSAAACQVARRGS